MKAFLKLFGSCAIALAMFSWERFGTQAHVSLLALASGDSELPPQTPTVLASLIADGVADPTRLPKATGQAPPGAVPNVAGNSYYLDPTSGVKVWRATSASYPCADNNGVSSHDYGDVLQISGDLGGNKHTLLIRTCGEYKLVDFVRGQGFSNWRSLAPDSYPAHDLSFTFSYKKDTPHIAYVTTDSGKLARYNTLTNTAEPIGNIPKSWAGVSWLQNDKYDRWFVANTAGNKGCVAFNSETDQIMTQTIPNFDECHLENNGRYVDLNTGSGGDYVWDLQTNAITPFNPPSPGHLFHLPSPSGFFVAVDVNTGTGKYPFYRMNPVDGSSTLISDFGGYGTDFHQSGSWLQEGTPETQQWVMYSAFGNHNPAFSPSPGYIYRASGFYRLDGSDFRFLAHTFHDWNDTYWEIPFTTCAADGKICMFNSNMNGRGDVYVAEVPLSGDSSPPLGQFASASAASFATNVPLTPNGILAGFGTGLSANTASATTLPLPSSLVGTEVIVRDATNQTRNAGLFFVSANQIKYLLPDGTANGVATITVRRDGADIAQGTAIIDAISPGLFTANVSGRGVAAAVILRRSNGVDTFEPVAQLNSAAGRFDPIEIDLGTDADQVFLIAFGTGFRAAPQSDISATIGGTPSPFVVAAASPGFAGLDQLNILIPRSLIGRKLLDVVFTASGRTANTVEISVK